MLSWPDHLLTLAEWDALPQDVSRQFELVEGMLQRGPRPSYRHRLAIKRLARQLDDAAGPSGYEVLPEVDVYLPGDPRPVVRAPDLIVVRQGVLDAAPARLTAADVVIAVEIVSPGSGRTDRIAKLADYAEAGIPYYWIVDLEAGVQVTAFRLAGGAYVATEFPEGPVPIVLDLEDV